MSKNAIAENKKRLCILCLSIFIITLHAEAELAIQNSYQISQQHFSLAYPASEEAIPMDNDAEFAELPEITLTPGEKRLILLKVLSRQTDQQDNSKNTILTQYAVKDLDLLNGSTLSPDHSILTSLGKTTTVSGEIMLANNLITPTNDIHTLKRRQAVIQYLLDHPEIMNTLESHLQQFAVNEDSILSLLDSSDTIYKGLFQRLDATRQFGLNPQSSNSKEMSRRFVEGLNLLRLGFIPASLIYYLSSLTTMQADFANYAAVLSNYPIRLAAAITLYALSLYQAQRSAKRERDYYSYVMERSRRPGIALSEARQLWVTVETYPLLNSVLLSCPSFASVKYSPELRTIFTLLQDAPGRPIASLWEYYTTHMGRYHMALDLLRRHRYSLLPVLQAVGEIDAWLTIARLVREGGQRDKNPITFAHYMSGHPSPYLRLDQFWNPHLLPETAVPNSVEIGADQPLNTIITGPNAAGKSTNMEGIAIAALLAQTFGIAPARSLVMTPFSLIHTHMDISSEIAAGLSTFKAESVRAIELMEHIGKMAKQQFSLTLMDEIFSSTNPIEGEAGTYGYLKILSEHPNAINICTTHYPRPALLADEYPERFQNMHVRADITDGRLSYDYRLKRGYSDQRIAIKILADEGIQSDFLDIATDIIQYPERYPLHGHSDQTIQHGYLLFPHE